MPESPSRTRALERLAADAAMLATPWPGSLDALLGVQGINARVYFQAWNRLAMAWKGTGRHPVPERWRTVGPRGSREGLSNRFARARGLQTDRAALAERVRPEYVMAHSQAHALMTEVALDCGYPASALKERIYAPARGVGEPVRAGLLVYTATAGTPGTLGGLVEVTRRFPRVLRSALERLRLCSGRTMPG